MFQHDGSAVTQPILAQLSEAHTLARDSQVGEVSAQSPWSSVTLAGHVLPPFC
jgi:hypothetical protein